MVLRLRVINMLIQQVAGVEESCAAAPASEFTDP